jgi:hypothetical protein
VALSVAAVSSSVWEVGPRGAAAETTRSFFGVMRVAEQPDPLSGAPLHLLTHGTTLHGVQSTAPGTACEPRLYYARPGPIGEVFEAALARGGQRIGAIGMGVGAVAAYARSNDRLTFFEIDPDVVAVATNPRWFTFLGACSGVAPTVILGDARRSLTADTDATFDLLLVDAFSSDAVPTHLLTVEAIEGYAAHLAPDGVGILHLSNRALDLVPVAAATVEAAGWVARWTEAQPEPGAAWYAQTQVRALVFARDAATLDRLGLSPRWAEPQRRDHPWTDDHADVVSAIRWPWREP